MTDGWDQSLLLMGRDTVIRGRVSVCVEGCAEVHWGVSGQGQGRHEEKTCVHACVHVPG